MSQGNTADMQDPARTMPADDEHRARIERLFREHKDNLLIFLKARFPAQDAREATQEAFLRLLSLDFERIRFLRGFLYRMAKNIAIDRRRRHGIDERARADMPLLLYSEMVDTLSPERRVSGEQEVQQLQRAIQTMPTKVRQAFTMHQIEGIDFAQIAAHMQLGESMVRKYVAKGLLHCRARLASEMESNHEQR